MRITKQFFQIVFVLIITISLFGGGTQLRDAAAAPAADPIYVDVDASGADDGTSWANAYTDLQDALAAAGSGNDIWVAEGVYTPGVNQTNTFILKADVDIYGGFAGTETLLSERDWEVNMTILSGDIGDDDTGDSSGVLYDTDDIVGGNSYHVVTGSGMGVNTVLDGFIITAGQANGTTPNNHGAGLYNEGGSPFLIRVTFSGNLADTYGGGMYNNSSSGPWLIDVNFWHNSANYGGGMLNNNNSSPILGNVSFWHNSADANGGGMNNVNGSSPTVVSVIFAYNSANYAGGMYNSTGSNSTLTNSTFWQNSAGTNGGGMYNYDSSPELTEVSFSQNSADGGHGGGMYNSASSPILSNVSFTGNSADASGGGVANSASSPALGKVSFSGNSAKNYGGGMYNHDSSPILKNVIFAGNSVGASGGGMYNEISSNPTLTNVTFSGNAAGIGGGGMNNYDSSPHLTNTIMWGNTGGSSPQIYNSVTSYTTISYSDIQGCGGSGSWDTDCGTTDAGGNIDADPLFVRNPDPGPDGTWDGVDDDYGDLHLRMVSPTIDSGTNTGCPGTDLDGNLRPNGEFCDMGAYEFWPKEIYLPLVVR